jgi:hypothetical protein
LAGFNIIYGKPAVKVVKFGLVWDAMARSLGTPDERMCEYFWCFAYFYIDIFVPLQVLSLHYKHNKLI